MIHIWRWVWGVVACSHRPNLCAHPEDPPRSFNWSVTNLFHAILRLSLNNTTTTVSPPPFFFFLLGIRLLLVLCGVYVCVCMRAPTLFQAATSSYPPPEKASCLRGEYIPGNRSDTDPLLLFSGRRRQPCNNLLYISTFFNRRNESGCDGGAALLSLALQADKFLRASSPLQSLRGSTQRLSRGVVFKGELSGAS